MSLQKDDECIYISYYWNEIRVLRLEENQIYPDCR